MRPLKFYLQKELLADFCPVCNNLKQMYSLVRLPYLTLVARGCLDCLKEKWR